MRRRRAEIRDPVVIRARERMRGIRIGDEMKPLGEPGRIQERLVDTHRIHVGEARPRIPRRFVHRMPYARIQFTDLIPRHPGPPDRMARQVRVHRVAHDLAVDLEIGIRFAVMAPQRLLAEPAKVGIEVFLPKLGRLDDMGVAIKYGDAPGHGCHGSDPPYQRVTEASGASAAFTSSSVGHQLGRSISVTRCSMIFFGASIRYRRRAFSPRNLA